MCFNHTPDESLRAYLFAHTEASGQTIFHIDPYLLFFGSVEQ